MDFQGHPLRSKKYHGFLLKKKEVATLHRTVMDHFISAWVVIYLQMQGFICCMLIPSQMERVGAAGHKTENNELF